MKCRDKENDEEFAVKILRKNYMPNGEIAMLEECRDMDNVVQLEEVLEDDKHTYIVMELLKGGELLQRIREMKKFTESVARNYFKQLIEAVSQIHGKGIVHRDLKPENIMFKYVAKKDVLKVNISDGFSFEYWIISFISLDCGSRLRRKTLTRLNTTVLHSRLRCAGNSVQGHSHLCSWLVVVGRDFVHHAVRTNAILTKCDHARGVDPEHPERSVWH